MQTVVPEWKLDVRRGPGWLLVKVRAASDSGPSHSGSLAKELWSLLESHLTYRLVLELDEIRRFDRPFLGQLARLYRRVRQHDGVLRLCGISPSNQKILEDQRLAEWLPPYEDAEEAVMGLRRKPR